MLEFSSETVGVEEAGRRLGVSRTTAYLLARQEGSIGGVPVIRVGKKLRVPVRGLERVLEGRQAA